MKLNKSFLGALIPLLAGNGSTMLEYSYESQDAIPEGYADLYTESGGTYVLSGVRGLKTPQDVSNVMGALEKERNDHSKTKAKFRSLDGMEVDDILKQLDRVAELEAASGDKLDEAALEKIVTARVQAKLSPLERQNKDLMATVDELTGVVTSYKKKETQNTIRTALSSVAREMKVNESALPDVELIGGLMFEVNEAGEVVTNEASGMAGLPAKVWLTDQQKLRPHWWPVSKGAGGLGGQGGGMSNNPFTHDGWNMTEQGRLVQTDRALAEKMAKSAGTTIGGKRPEK